MSDPPVWITGIKKVSWKENYKMNTIYNEIAEEFGSQALSINNPQPEISIKRAAQLLKEMGFENAKAYLKAGGR